MTTRFERTYNHVDLNTIRGCNQPYAALKEHLYELLLNDDALHDASVNYAFASLGLPEKFVDPEEAQESNRIQDMITNEQVRFMVKILCDTVKDII